MNFITSFTDNPIFVKHIRSRLRRSQFLPPAVIVIVLCLFICYAGWEFNWFANGTAFGYLVALQSIVLPIVGATQIGTSVGGARESGILDFHRVSPLSPRSITIGFFFGAPIREYALFALILPFTLFCVWHGALTFWEFVESMIVLLLNTWLLHAISLLTVLAAKKPKSGAKGIVALPIILFVIASWVFFVIKSAGNPPGVPPQPLRFSFFGIEVPWLIFAFLYALPTLFFLLLAAVRKMRSERAHLFSKPEAIFCLLVQVILILGGTWSIDASRWFSAIPLFVLYGLCALACVLIVTITPNLGEYSKGVRRAERQGIVRLSYWDDLALNRLTVAVICLIVLVGATIMCSIFKSRVAVPMLNNASFDYSIPIAIGVLVVAYFGSALQFFLLTMPRRGSTMMGLFLFFIWLVPLITGAITSGMNSQFGEIIISISPFAGLAYTSGGSHSQDIFWIRLAALLPTLVFFVLFNTLVTSARRKALARIHSGSDRAKPRGTEGSPIDDEPELLLN